MLNTSWRVGGTFWGVPPIGIVGEHAAGGIVSLALVLGASR